MSEAHRRLDAGGLEGKLVLSPETPIAARPGAASARAATSIQATAETGSECRSVDFAPTVTDDGPGRGPYFISMAASGPCTRAIPRRWAARSGVLRKRT